MCEAHAYMLRDEKEEKLLDSVDIVEFSNGDVILTNIFGEQKYVKAKLKVYDNSKNKILFEPI